MRYSHVVVSKTANLTLLPLASQLCFVKTEMFNIKAGYRCQGSIISFHSSTHSVYALLLVTLRLSKRCIHPVHNTAFVKLFVQDVVTLFLVTIWLCILA